MIRPSRVSMRACEVYSSSGVKIYFVYFVCLCIYFTHISGLRSAGSNKVLLSFGLILVA